MEGWGEGEYGGWSKEVEGWGEGEYGGWSKELEGERNRRLR